MSLVGSLRMCPVGQWTSMAAGVLFAMVTLGVRFAAGTTVTGTNAGRAGVVFAGVVCFVGFVVDFVKA
jgi:hypothetical protein